MSEITEELMAGLIEDLKSKLPEGTDVFLMVNTPLDEEEECECGRTAHSAASYDREMLLFDMTNNLIHMSEEDEDEEDFPDEKERRKNNAGNKDVN